MDICRNFAKAFGSHTLLIFSLKAMRGLTLVFHSMSLFCLKRRRKIKSKAERENDNKKKNAIYCSSPRFRRHAAGLGESGPGRGRGGPTLRRPARAARPGRRLRCSLSAFSGGLRFWRTWPADRKTGSTVVRWCLHHLSCLDLGC